MMCTHIMTILLQCDAVTHTQLYGSAHDSLRESSVVSCHLKTVSLRRVQCVPRDTLRWDNKHFVKRNGSPTVACSYAGCFETFAPEGLRKMYAN